MTSLLVAVREDAEVVKYRDNLMYTNWVHLGATEQADAEEAYDTALLRAAVREIAKRVRGLPLSEARSDGYSFGYEDGLCDAADFVEGMAE